MSSAATATEARNVVAERIAQSVSKRPRASVVARFVVPPLLDTATEAPATGLPPAISVPRTAARRFAAR
jgi:hypothetical protein